MNSYLQISTLNVEAVHYNLFLTCIIQCIFLTIKMKNYLFRCQWRWRSQLWLWIGRTGSSKRLPKTTSTSQRSSRSCWFKPRSNTTWALHCDGSVDSHCLHPSMQRVVTLPFLQQHSWHTCVASRSAIRGLGASETPASFPNHSPQTDNNWLGLTTLTEQFGSINNTSRFRFLKWYF